MSGPSLHRVVDETGVVIGEHDLTDDELVDLFRAMVAARAYDTKASAMQRQGRLATYAPFTGQEAAQIGSAAALQNTDWMVATYRDAAAMWYHGYPWLNLMLGRTGDERGGQAPAGVNVLPPSITVGGHMIHAVGISWASKIRHEPSVAITYFGDGATSEGDFHEAMNFAGVYRTPTVFLCQNNGWAISLPFDRQTAAATIAQKADGYGMGGVRVDGNDVIAVHQVTRRAVAAARRGDGPTLIEAVTYRVGPHTTADDDSRYRSAEDVDDWRRRDPISRMRAVLQAGDLWSQQWEDEIATTEAAAVEAAVGEAEATPPLSAEGIFDAMFSTLPAHLEAQRAMAQRRAGDS